MLVLPLIARRPSQIPYPAASRTITSGSWAVETYSSRNVVASVVGQLLASNAAVPEINV